MKIKSYIPPCTANMAAAYSSDRARAYGSPSFSSFLFFAPHFLPSLPLFSLDLLLLRRSRNKRIRFEFAPFERIAFSYGIYSAAGLPGSTRRAFCSILLLFSFGLNVFPFARGLSFARPDLARSPIIRFYTNRRWGPGLILIRRRDSHSGPHRQIKWSFLMPFLGVISEGARNPCPEREREREALSAWNPRFEIGEGNYIASAYSGHRWQSPPEGEGAVGYVSGLFMCARRGQCLGKRNEGVCWDLARSAEISWGLYANLWNLAGSTLSWMDHPIERKPL